MRTILDWLRHLLWRAEAAAAAADGLQVWLAVGDVDLAARLEVGEGEPDLVLQAEDADQAATMLAELAALQTVGNVVVLGAAEQAPAARRRLARVARGQRQYGVWVSFD